jgi:hypothetical protein
MRELARIIAELRGAGLEYQRDKELAACEGACSSRQHASKTTRRRGGWQTERGFGESIGFAIDPPIPMTARARAVRGPR